MSKSLQKLYDNPNRAIRRVEIVVMRPNAGPELVVMA
jgi:hypothetical protein